MSLILDSLREVTRSETNSDVCILGAGPHGLAAAVHLRSADPDLVITTLDPSGSWLEGWKTQFARAEIKTLRSPAVHHPSPDPYALSQFIAEKRLPRSGLEYDLPTREAFTQFCDALVDDARLDDPLAARPNAISSDGKHVTVTARNVRVTARYLIAATNPHRRCIPRWVSALAGHEPHLVRYGGDVDLSALPDLAGENIAIIGGGLTAAHLACGAAARGASVQLICRRNLNVRNFDTPPGWLGPKYLKGFDAETDPVRRLAIAREARSGGSMPKWMHARLTNFDGIGDINLREQTTVRFAEPNPDGGCHLHLDHEARIPADRVWLATGTQAHPYGLRCLRHLLADVAEVQGFPLLNEHLRLGPHPAFMMGRAATLTLGPAAGNLWGAQRAAERITQAITGHDLAAHRNTWIQAPASRN